MTLSRALEVSRRKHVYGGLYLPRNLARKVIALLRKGEEKR